jgi:hypothetical protein
MAHQHKISIYLDQFLHADMQAVGDKHNWSQIARRAFKAALADGRSTEERVEELEKRITKLESK